MDYLTTADIWKFALLAIAGSSMIIAFWVGIQALFPTFIRRAQDAYSRPCLCLGLGVAAAAVVALVAGLLTKIGHGAQIPGGAIIGVAAVLALAGSAGLARRIGTGLLNPIDKEQPWRRTLRGGIVLGTLLLIPLFNLIPGVPLLVTGLGASILSFSRARREKAERRREDLAEPFDADQDSEL